MALINLIEDLKKYEGITRKKGILKITEFFKDITDFGATEIGPGDDAAAIRDGDSYLLLAADGIWKKMVESDPYRAGRASVIVNVNDIFAMGGTPVAMVNIISCSTNYDIEALLKGIKDGCNLYHVPMIGGHYHPDSDSNELSVAILGRAKRLLRSNNAKIGQKIIAAIDLNGARGQGSVYSWNSNRNKTAEQILGNLNILVKIAEEKIANTAKDISNPGIPGTLAMLLESSNKGAEVHLQNIPKPVDIDLIDWLKIYPSYGFIVCADPGKCDDLLSLFTENGISANIIGEIINENNLYLNHSGEREIFFDFSKESIF